jgi:hypothetical protein
MLNIKLFISIVSVLSSRFLQYLLIFYFNVNICLVRGVVQKTQCIRKEKTSGLLNKTLKTRFDLRFV